jgi:hypothetical protein
VANITREIQGRPDTSTTNAATEDGTIPGQQELSTKIPFVWQPEKHKQQHTPRTAPGQKEYRTTHIHQNLWLALDIKPSPNIEKQAAIITPIFYWKGVRG